MRADPRRGRPASLLSDGYDKLAALPTDPGALLRWAYAEAEDVTGAGLSEHGDVYAVFNGMRRGNVLPPDLEAAIFRASSRTPSPARRRRRGLLDQARNRGCAGRLLFVRGLLSSPTR